MKSRRVSHIEMMNEKTELKNLLREEYHAPRNSGSLPGAIYNDAKDVLTGESPLDTWIYPASK